MNFGSDHVYLYDSSDEEYIPEEVLSHGIQLSLNLDDEEPRPKPRPLPGYGDSRGHRSTTPPLREEMPQLIPIEDLYEGSTTKYMCDQSSDDEDEDEEVTLQPSEGATAAPVVTPPLKPPPAQPVGILKKKPGKKHLGGMVQWMSWHDTGNFKYILKKYQPTLAENINLPDLIPHLNQHNLLSDEENDILLDSKLTHKERILKLLSFVDKKNTILYMNFLQALEEETNHPGHKMLADMLKRATERQEQELHGIRSRQLDTNVVAVTFDTLGGPANIHTGDVVVCTNQECTAVLCHLSKVTGGSDADKKVWVCEFCGTKNEVDIVAEEMPTSEETTYLLTPPITSTGANSATSTAGIEQSLLVFCIDTSGSMGVTTEVAGKVRLKSDDKLRRLSVSLNADIETQYMPRQSRNVTYISRLQSVQAAIDDQLTSLAKSHPSQRIALISFNDEVLVMGDGQTEGTVVAGDKLSSVDALLEIGGELTLPSSVSHSRDALAKKVNMLEEGGQTALGPALLLSVLLAGRVPGSKVIVCTDGLANKGLGSLDESKASEAFNAAQQFYKDLGDIALEKGVTVSVVTIKGEECRIMELGQVADATGGNVTRVDPSTVATEFSSIVSNPVIATNVACKLILHDRLYFRTEDVKGNIVCVPVGNVTADTEFSFEYGVKKLKSKTQEPSQDPEKSRGKASDESVSTPPLIIDGKPHLPFQLQTEYTASDGSVLVRVITKVKPVTEDRNVAERDIDMDVMGCHALRTSANLAAEGKFSEARTGAIASQRLMKRSLEHSKHKNTMKKSSYIRSMSSIAPLEKTLREKQLRVRSMPTTKDLHSEACLMPSPMVQSESMLKSAFDKRKSTSFGKRAMRSLMSINSSIPRRSSSIASTSVTTSEEASHLRMESEDSLAVEIFQAKKASSFSKTV